ncbi:MAG: Dyp-type peroxidase [Proteobacteria bacterium]|nr:Dyp-type peroxidase [Pseudomonadota bacterium]
MQRELIVKSIGLGMSSDLTLLAPLRSGFVPSLDSVSYKTRVKSVLAVLQGARQSAHEYAAARLLSDAVERVGVIQSVRVAVMEPEDSVLLSVTFDGPWQAYIRVLWDKVGALLDLIFCNTQNYQPAWGSSFEQWVGWARSVQRETGFFYGPPASSATDLLYDRRLLRMRERYPGADATLDELRAVMPSAEEAVDRLASPGYEPVRDDPPIIKPDMFRVGAEQLRQHLQALAGLYRLTDLYVPATADGDFLHRAAIELLREFIALYNGHNVDPDIAQQRERFKRALDWLCPPGTTLQGLARQLPPIPPASTIDPAVRADVQGGILHQYESLTHGVLLLLSFDSAQAVDAFLQAVAPTVTRDSDNHAAPSGTVYRNIAFTPDGLRACGLDEDTMAMFPEEFLQGMAARAGALGDVRHNHPRRWRLPKRFVPKGSAPTNETIDLAGVHAVVQLRCQATGAAQLAADDLEQANHPLAAEVGRLAGLHPQARLMAVQSMRRRYALRGGEQVVVEHFGYADGNGQPDLEWAKGRQRRANRVLLGEVLWGHPNRADDPPAANDARRPWMANGSFLVLRKYRQFPDRLHAAVQRTADEMERQLGGKSSDHLETVYGKLMGRQRDGTPLEDATPGDLNDFDFSDDPQGARCPLHAHIRRANPRDVPSGSSRPPRLIRRSMSYGPTADAPVGEDRGLVFMAYNQNLGEQFEVVQRWLAGGNSTGSSSAIGCPIVGVPENGFPRVYTFEAPDPSGRPFAFEAQMEDATPLFEDPEVVTQLQWGVYLFAPSISALGRLAGRATQTAAAAPSVPVPWEADAQVQQAQQRIARLLAMGEGEAALEAWKQALEDPDPIDRQQSAALWAAIRRFHGGALKTPYATLVAERDLALHVLRRDDLYSVCGQRQRMLVSFGDIYLGLDAGARYARESADMNKAIGQLSFQGVFDYARDAAAAKIGSIVDLAKRSSKTGETRWETIFEAREVMDEVLATLSEQWFGVQDRSDGLLARGSADWAWAPGQPSIYPGHFTALSRNMFQPNPGQVPVDLAKRYGQALRDHMGRFVQRHAAVNHVPEAPRSGAPAPLALAAFNQLAAQGRDFDFVGRLITGVLMGFTPTIIGAVLNVLLEWRRNDRFGALRSALAGRTDAASARSILMDALHEAAKIRPMPQITWRTVMQPHHMAKTDRTGIALDIGCKVALGLVAGTQQSLADGNSDNRLMFGGVRQAAGPTHACPGYEAGTAAMLGSLVAFLTCTEDMREGPQPLTYALQGVLPAIAAPVPAAVGTAVAVAARSHPALPAAMRAMAALAPHANLEAFRMTTNPVLNFVPVPAAGTRTGLIMAWGDSWVAYDLGGLIPFGTDLRDCLVKFGYKVPGTFCDFLTWGTIQAMAQNPGPFCTALDRAITPQRQPVAVLLSAGGNDSTRDALAALVLPQGSATVLDAAKTAAHIATLEGYFRTVLSAIQQIIDGTTIKVLVHGYDHPIPNGKGSFALQQEWLYDVFEQAGYAVGPGGADMPAATQAMADLIDQHNTMLANLSGPFPFVTYVDLRGTIALHYPSPSDGWADDLHPMDEMFEAMAAKIDAAI